MKEFPVTVGSKINLAKRLEQAVADCGLTLQTDATLRTLPGSRHWRIKKPGQRGTLEATWLPAEGRFWFSVHDNRTGKWIARAIADLTPLLEAR